MARWRLGGFREFYGRTPDDHDFIVPDPRTMGAFTCSQAGKAMRKVERLTGVEHKPGRLTHGLRRFFISHARQCGARPDVLERITHNRSGDIIDTYTSFEWEPLCEAMLCFKVDLRPADVIALPQRATRSDVEPIVEDGSESVSRFVANDSFTIQNVAASGGGGGNRTLSAAIR